MSSYYKIKKERFVLLIEAAPPPLRLTTVEGDYEDSVAAR
jgi:hypothetical protein